MKIRTIIGALTLAAIAVAGTGQAAAASSARPVQHDAPATLQLGGTAYRTSAITAGIGHLDMSNGTVALKADARRSLSAADFTELSRFAAATNAANGPATSAGTLAANACYKKIYVSFNSNGYHVHLPNCAVKSTAAVLGSIAAIVAAAGNIDEISDRAAKAIGAAIAADAAALVAWAAVCDVFGSGDITVNLTLQFVPYPGCD